MDLGMWIAQISFAFITLFWLWMLVEAIVRQPSLLSKLIWGIVVLLFYLLGALIYFFVKRQNKPYETYAVCIILLLSCVGTLPWLLR